MTFFVFYLGNKNKIVCGNRLFKKGKLIYYVINIKEMHIVLNMSKHCNRILELTLRLLEEQGKKTFVVPYVCLS
jgi:hypothetical protein